MNDVSDQPERLNSLLGNWHEYIAAHPPLDPFSRESGYIAGLSICAEQLAAVLEGMRTDD